jgi:hypothetical protein
MPTTLPPVARQRRIIRNAARSEGIKPRILWGLYGAETGFGENIQESSAGAQGPFQFMPETARGMGIDPHNFRQAAFGAARYLGQYKDRGVAGMLAAYNAGPAGDPNNPETAAYIPKVRELAQTWKPPGGGGGRPGGRAGGGRPGTSAAQLPQGTTGVADLLGSLLGQQQAVVAPTSAPAEPAHSARASLALPKGYAPPAPTSSPVPKQSITDLLGELPKTVADGLTPIAVGPNGRVEQLAPGRQGREQGADAALGWAKSKVGFVETGENSGGIASKLNRRFGFSNAPWCAMFTSAAVTRGGAPEEARSASVDEIRAKAQRKEGYHGFVNPARAKPGDLILWDEHIGMVERVRNGKIEFVAGNHSDGVREDSTSIGDAIQVVRPMYRQRGRRR